MTGKKMETYDRIYRRIEAEMSNRLEDEEQQWLSLTWGKELLENENVGAALERDQAEWKNGTSRLATFVRHNAPRLFIMLVYTKNEKLLEQFCDKGNGDAMFPVKVKLGRTHVSIEENPPIKLELGPKFKKLDAATLFDYWQWLFFVPELRWTTFEHPPLDSKCNLPFLTRREISRTEFSIVYQSVIHRDHVTFDSDGLVSAQAAAITCC